MKIEDVKFLKSDCTVSGAIVDNVGRGGNRSPRWGGGIQGQIVGERFLGQGVNAVTIIHHPTQISTTVDTFTPKRNRELAFIKLEMLVNKWIEEVKARMGS
jgi:hypothetical protein